MATDFGHKFPSGGKSSAKPKGHALKVEITIGKGSKDDSDEMAKKNTKTKMKPMKSMDNEEDGEE